MEWLSPKWSQGKFTAEMMFWNLDCTANSNSQYLNVSFSDGQRVTTARAYLRNENQRPNLNVLVRARVVKVLFDGKQAIGVEYIHRGVLKKVYASNEVSMELGCPIQPTSKRQLLIRRIWFQVILSAGALNSPQLLMLSGIGPRHTLEALDIPVISNLPVGYNLRNHFGVTINFVLEKLVNTQSLDWAVLSQYLENRDGPMSADGITQVSSPSIFLM